MSLHPDTVTSLLQEVAGRYASLPEVRAIAVGGSHPASRGDSLSDIDLYIYGEQPSLEARTAIARAYAPDLRERLDIGLDLFGPGDEWIAQPGGVHFDVMYWAPDWIEDHVQRVLERHEAWLGYTTCFWYTVLRSSTLHDPSGWFQRLQSYAAQPYPDELARAIVARNHPVLRDTHSSYRYQINSAVARRDRVSINHRVAALLSSYFDIVFAINRQPHPGEKRLLMQAAQLDEVPGTMAEDVETLLCGMAAPWEANQTMQHVDRLLDNLEHFLQAKGWLPL